MNFEGLVINFESKENEFTAKIFDGTAWTKFEKTNNTPSSVKVDAKCDKGSMNISIQYKNRNPVQIMNFVGWHCETINLSDYKNGKYEIMVRGKSVENVSIKYEFI